MFHSERSRLCFSRCGEDECPLNELLVLQLEAEHPNEHNRVSRCKVFGNYWNQENKTILAGEAETNSVKKVLLYITISTRCSHYSCFSGRANNVFWNRKFRALGII